MENEILISGAIPDPRSEEQKAFDYTHTEILASGASAPAFTWTEKPFLDWKLIALRKQITSSSCGGQAGAEVLEDEFGLVISATPTYRFRSNYPEPGMWPQDLGNILKNKHTTSEALCPSQNMTEDQMNSAVIPTSLPYGIGAYYFLPIGNALDMDLVATALESGHGIIWQIDSNAEEWQQVPVATTAPITFSHFVGTSNKQNYFLHNGVKSVAISDSCNAFSTIKDSTGNLTGQRVLTETFLRARCYSILVLVPTLQYNDPAGKPQHSFSVKLQYGSTGPEVEAWQQVLQYEKFLPTSTSSGALLPLGNFLSMTAQATKKWQVAHGIMDFANETDVTKIRVGPKTILEANKIYS